MNTDDLNLHDGVATAIRGDTIVIVWKSPLTAERWRWGNAFIEPLLRTSANGVVVLSLVLASSDPPDAATRAQIQADFRKFGDGLRRYIVLPLGNSLWQSIVRTLVRAILMVSGHTRRHVVASTFDEALGRLQEVATAETPSSSDIRRVADALLQAVSPTAGALHT